MLILNSSHPPKEFDEMAYLDLNKDVFQAVQRGTFCSGWEHFYTHGVRENRPGVSSEVKRLVAEIFEDTSLVPPDGLHNVGGGDYIALGAEILGSLVYEAGLKPENKVLDVGCGTGRVARYLTRYLTSGTYDGTDIVKESIDWCQESYFESYPNFHFHFSDIYNKMYNPSGIVQAHEYRFPFNAESFDFIFLTSVFTHMFAVDMENYLSEISRVLEVGGTCLITFFLLNTESIQLINNQLSDFSFRYELQGCRAENQEVPENAVAFAEEEIRRLYRKYNLEIIEPVRYGKWCLRKDNASGYQDKIIARKRA